MQHYSSFHGYSTSWIQSNLSKVLTIGKRGLTDWLFESSGQFEEILVKKRVMSEKANYEARQLKKQITENSQEDSDELIFVSEQNTKKRRTSRDQTSSFSDACVPVQKVAPMRPTIVPQTTTPPIQNHGKTVSRQKSNARPRNKCMPPLVVNYLDKDNMEKFSSEIQNSLQKLLKANNLAPRN